MKKFEVGQKYAITSDAAPLSIARIVARDGAWAEFEFMIAGKVRRYTWRIRTVYDTLRRPNSEVVAPSEYDAIFAYNAFGKQ